MLAATEVYMLVAGIDVCDDNYIRVAFLKSTDGHCSYTEDLHRYRDLRALHRRWWTHLDDGIPVAAAMLATCEAGVGNWLSERRIALHRFQPHLLQPFLQEARDLEVPRRYRLAHALARCAAMRLTASRQLEHLETTFSELTFLLRDAQADLTKLAAATRPPP